MGVEDCSEDWGFGMFKEVGEVMFRGLGVFMS
jgi:hypothetical protein